MLFFIVSRGGGQRNARQLKTNSHGERPHGRFHDFKAVLQGGSIRNQESLSSFLPSGPSPLFSKMISGFE
jgi:hypothetical protein